MTVMPALSPGIAWLPSVVPTLATFTALDWSIIAVYLLLMMAVGWWASRGQADEQSYFLGSRRMPTWAVTLSILATSLSAATYIGVPQIGFKGDLTYLMLNIGGVLGVLIVAGFFLPPLYRAGTVTIYGYLDKRFGPEARVAASIAFLVGRLLASGARLFMAGIAFSLVLFDKTSVGYVVAAIVLFGVVGTAYTCMGGIKAVIWTDTIQILMVIGAALLCIFVLLDRIPLSLPEIVEQLRNAGPDGTTDKLRVYSSGFTAEGYEWGASYTLMTALAITFLNVGAYGTDQDLVQRMMTTRSPWRASLSVIGANLIGIPVVLLFALIGSLLYLYFQVPGSIPEGIAARTVDDSRGVYPQFLVYHLPAGLSGLAMAGLFAAAMSTLDSSINAMASSAVADLKLGGVNRLAGSRVVVVIMGALLTVFACGAAVIQQAGKETLIDFALGVMAFAYAGLLGVFGVALFTRRGSAGSVVAALFVGAAVVLVLQPWSLGGLTEMVWGEPFTLPFAFWLPIASSVAFVVCMIPRGKAVETTEAR